MLITIITMKDKLSNQIIKQYNTINQDTLIRDLRIEFKDPESNKIAENTKDYDIYLNGFRDTEKNITYTINNESMFEIHKGELKKEITHKGQKHLKEYIITGTQALKIGNALEILKANKVNEELASLIDANLIQQELENLKEETSALKIDSLKKEIEELKKLIGNTNE